MANMIQNIMKSIATLNPDPKEVYELRALNYAEESRNAGRILGEAISNNFIDDNNMFNTKAYLEMASSNSPADINKLNVFKSVLNFDPANNSLLRYMDSKGEKKSGYLEGFDKTSSTNDKGEALYTPVILTEKDGVKVVTENRTADPSDPPMLMTAGEIGQLMNFQIGAVASAVGPVAQGALNLSRVGLSRVGEDYINLNYGEEAANNLSRDAQNKAIQALIIAADQANPGVSKQLDEQVGNSIEASPTPVATVPTVPTATTDQPVPQIASSLYELESVGGISVDSPAYSRLIDVDRAGFIVKGVGVDAAKSEIFTSIRGADISTEEKTKLRREYSEAEKAAREKAINEAKLAQLETNRRIYGEGFDDMPATGTDRRSQTDVLKREEKYDEQQVRIEKEIKEQTGIINNFNNEYSKVFNQQSPLAGEVTSTTGESAEEIDKAPILNQLPTISVNSTDDELREWYRQYEERGNYTPDQLKEVQGLLNDLNINSVKDVGDAVKQGKITPAAANKTFALIAALMSQNNPDSYMKLYQGMINQANYGDPSLSAKDLSTLSASSAKARQDATVKANETIAEAIQAQSDFTVNSIESRESYDSGQMRNVTRKGLADVEALARSGLISSQRAEQENYRLIKAFLASEIASGSIQNKTLMDRISDIFKRDSVTSFMIGDNIRTRRNSKNQPVELVLVNPTNPNAETEASATARQVLNRLGPGYYNLFLKYTPTLGE